MKKLHLIIFFLLCSLSTLGQEGPTATKVMRLILPKGTEKLDKGQLKSLSHRRFSDETALDFHDHVYKKDGMLIYFVNLSEPHILKKSLERKQRMMSSLTSQLKDNVLDSSKIINVNNIRFLIIESHENDNVAIQFTSDYDKNGACINGFIEYKRTDDKEAKQYLHDLLGSMHFEDN